MDAEVTTKKRKSSKEFVMRQGWLMSGLGWAVACGMRLWLGTLRMHYELADQRLDLRRKPHQNIYCLWHEDLLLGSYFFRNCNTHVMVSNSADGEFIARTLEHLGFQSIRGSTGHGGGRAVLKILRDQESFDLAITPDGPLGPRREFQMGAVYLASRLGMPLVPLGFGFERPWRTYTWDEMALPRPFSRAVVCSGQALHVPADANSAMLEQFRQQASAELQAVSARAQAMTDEWAATGIHPAKRSETDRARGSEYRESA